MSQSHLEMRDSEAQVCHIRAEMNSVFDPNEHETVPVGRRES